MKGFNFIDTGFLLVVKDKDLVSPISVLFYEEYLDKNELNIILNREVPRIQCIISDEGWYNNSIPFGSSQLPKVWDYPDNVDTMRFLIDKVGIAK